MQRKNVFRVLIMIWLLLIVLNTQEIFVEAKRQTNFRSLTIEDGLSQATVETLYQDSKGYIWFGTNDGLDRYNGYTFKKIYNKRGVKESLVHNYILDIKEDWEGNKWVSTTKGISKLDAFEEYITNYKEEDGYLSNGTVDALLITSDKKIYAGTAEGINVYNEVEDKFILTFPELKNVYITSLAEDNKGNIWAGTYNGLYKIEIKTGKISHYEEGDEENSLLEDKIYSIYYDDKEDYLWIGGYNKGVCVLDLASDEIKRINLEIEDSNSTEWIIRGFLRDSKGSLWICSSNGLLQYGEDKIIQYTNRPYDNSSIIDNDTFNIIEDSSGQLWIGTYSGVSSFDPYNKISHYKNDPFNNNSINENMIGGVYEDDDGLLWIGTNSQGINILNRESENITYINSNTEGVKLSNDSIQDITGYDKYIFIATYNGLNIINKEDKTLKVYTMENGLSGNNIKKIYYDDSGFLWIGSTVGLDVLNLNTERIICLNELLSLVGIENKFISALYKDSNGDYWIGTFLNEGLLRIITSESRVEIYKNIEDDFNSLSDNTIRCINEDSKGNIWIGTSSGVNKYNVAENNFKIYSTEDGLANNTIYGILFDEENNPWISSNLGISKINIKTNVISNLNTTDGLQSNEFNGNCAYKNKKGEFIFGGINGINIFNPKDVKITNKEFNIVLDEFEINGTVVGNIDRATLKNSENNIKITFFLPNYKSMKNIQYYYSLDDDDWIALDNNYVILANLANGKYNLKIRARASDGSLSEFKTVEFEILPPIWKSKKAICIYILLGLLLYINNRREVKKLDKMVLKRTKQLSDEMEKSTELLNKVIDLERKKNNYFVNLSHELRTPLNVISSTQQLIVELNKDGVGIMREKLDKYMDIVGRNSNRLLKMINDIIDTSKIENGNYHLDIKENDIVYLVEEGVLTLKEYIEEKGVSLIVDPEIEEKIIRCDYEALERCIVNLVSNAVKFTKEGDSITVKVKDDQAKVVIEVIDTGVGIDKEYHETIFNRFNQVIDENAEKSGGSGLGLTITKQIIELHKGEIKVESEVGKGSKFIITLPA